MKQPRARVGEGERKWAKGTGHGITRRKEGKARESKAKDRTRINGFDYYE